VSGYLHPKRHAVVGDTVDGRSHAWIQAWTGGWWDYDPTNDTKITEQFVEVTRLAQRVEACGTRDAHAASGPAAVPPRRAARAGCRIVRGRAPR
jgi:transglutaminase-like putative cysteine protease